MKSLLHSSAFRSRRAVVAFAALLPMGWATTSHAQPTCNETNTPFQAVYAQQVPFGNDVVTEDLVVHSYKFEPRVNMTVCSIGYQSPSLPPLKYRFKLTDVTVPASPVVLYNQALNAAINFPPSPPFTPSYVPVNPITLVGGHIYELRRTAIGYSNDAQLIGRLVNNQAGQFPISAGTLTILSSKFYGGGGPSIDTMLPFIDFGTY